MRRTRLLGGLLAVAVTVAPSVGSRPTATGRLGRVAGAAVVGAAPLALVPTDRLAGDDRYATAATVSRTAFSPGVPVVLVATGATFPDALAGGAAGAVAGGPLLLTDPLQPSPAMLAEIDRLHPRRVVVLGGPGAVGDDVVTAIAGEGATVGRVAGGDRFATAAAVSAAFFSPGVPVAYLATGANYPDALSAGPAAGVDGGPVLLTSPDVLPDATAAELARLRPDRVVVLGGTLAVSDAVAASAAAAAGAPVERVAGEDRYATSVAMSRRSWPSATTVFVATGASFADALAAGATAGHEHMPLLLVSGTDAPDPVVSEVRRLQPSRIVVLGGPGAIAPAVEDELAGGPKPSTPAPALAGPPPPGGHFSFEGTNPDGSPMRWDPCAPVHYVINPAGAPAGGVADVQAAIQRAAAATGMNYVYDGTTDEPLTEARQIDAPSRYPGRWAPVLVGWVRPGQTDVPVGGSVVGMGYYWWYKSAGTATQVIVSGMVALNSSVPLNGGIATMDSWGGLAMHELGHTIGLAHVNDPNEAMNPYIVRGRPAAWGPGDLNGLYRLGRSQGCIQTPPAP